MLLEYANAAAAIAGSRAGASVAALLKDQELVDLVTGAPPTDTWKRQLDLIVAGVTGDKTIRQHLEGLTTFQAPGVAALGAFRESLAHLQGKDSETLQYLMQGTLDLAAHRLDAWVTSFATKRLASMRAAQPQGVYVGGYGWVENLRPAPASVAGTPVTPPPGRAGAAHGATPATAASSTRRRWRTRPPRRCCATRTWAPAACRRSPGRLPSTCPRGGLREAKWLLDGVRQGQPLGALLGYRFERRLHELGMDRFIHPLARGRTALGRQAAADRAARWRALPPTTWSMAWCCTGSGSTR